MEINGDHQSTWLQVTVCWIGSADPRLLGPYTKLCQGVMKHNGWNAFVCVSLRLERKALEKTVSLPWLGTVSMCSLHLTHPRSHTPGAVGSRCPLPGEQLGVRWLAQGSHLSRGKFLQAPRFEPTTSGYKSNGLSIRPRLPHVLHSRYMIWLIFT